MRVSILNIIGILLLISNQLLSQEEVTYQSLAYKILKSSKAEDQLKWSVALKKSIVNELRQEDNIVPLDSTGLLIELISNDKAIQMVSWAIKFNEEWEYYGVLKSYDQVKKEYQIFDLTATDYKNSINNRDITNHESWPAGIYTKLIENEYNKRVYYTFLGWISPEDQTAYKFIELMTLSKSGKPYFGKTNYFKEDKNYSKRILFSYSRQSHFTLDYGEYEYSKKKWNKKKKKYDIQKYSDHLIVFDHLISKFPNMPYLPEFLVPIGNSIDAFKFENGKWVFISDIDARNLKRKSESKEVPKLDLFEKTDTNNSN